MIIITARGIEIDRPRVKAKLPYCCISDWNSTILLPVRKFSPSKEIVNYDYFTTISPLTIKLNAYNGITSI